MKKTYIQPELDILSVASLENFLTASFETSAKENENFDTEKHPEIKDDYNKDPWA